MRLTIIILGVLFILSGFFLLFYPKIFYGFMENNLETPSLYIAAIIGRFIFGILLIKSANESKYPMILRIFGILTIIAAITFIFIGHEKFQHLLAFIIPALKPYIFMVGLITIAVGCFLIYSFLRQEINREKKS